VAISLLKPPCGGFRIEIAVMAISEAARSQIYNGHVQRPFPNGKIVRSVVTFL
jgi:hypothetical protein